MSHENAAQMARLRWMADHLVADAAAWYDLLLNAHRPRNAVEFKFNV